MSVLLRSKKPAFHYLSLWLQKSKYLIQIRTLNIQLKPYFR